MPVNFGDLAEPALFDGLEEKLEGRIVSEHVTHLNGESALIGLAMHLSTRSQFLSGWLIEMNVFSGFQASQSRGHELVDIGLHRDQLDFGIVEDLFGGQPGR